jgi:polyisoprenyl-phosphate glycosyltransferase
MQFPDADPIPAVSIVAPCFNEEYGLAEFHRRSVAACRAACCAHYEIVLVDDGSHDGTWTEIERLAAHEHNVVGVRLMRNHGHQAAASAGLALARGDRVLLIDADLQDPPELLDSMMRTMDDERADVVFGQRIARAGETRFKRISAATFYRLLARLAAVPIPADTGDFRLMRRRIVDALVAMPERQRFIRGMVCWVGGRQVPLRYERRSRIAGRSNYPMAKMVQLALDAITSFSTIPLRLAAYLGFVSTLIAIGLLAITVWSWWMGRTAVGWSSIMTAIVFFGAVQLIMLGILGEYVGRLCQEAKQRPLFLVDQVVAGGCGMDLPAEFANLGPTARRQIWDSARRVASRTTRLSPNVAPVERFDALGMTLS